MISFSFLLILKKCQYCSAFERLPETRNVWPKNQHLDAVVVFFAQLAPTTEQLGTHAATKILPTLEMHCTWVLWTAIFWGKTIVSAEIYQKPFVFLNGPVILEGTTRLHKQVSMRRMKECRYRAAFFYSVWHRAKTIRTAKRLLKLSFYHDKKTVC